MRPSIIHNTLNGKTSVTTPTTVFKKKVSMNESTITPRAVYKVLSK